MALVKWNPAKELLNVEREFNKLFNSLSTRFGFGANGDDEYDNAVWMPLTDIIEEDDRYVLQLDLPGVSKKEVKISYSNGQLIVSGERKQEKERKGAAYHRVERAYGKYYRSFNLPDKIMEDKIEAEFKDGSLTVIIPKAEEVRPKEIEVKVK